MKRIILTILFGFFLSLLALAQPEDFVKGELIVMFDSGREPKSILNENSDFNLIRCLSKPGNIWLVSYDQSGLNDDAALTKLSSSSGVKVAQFNHKIKSRATPNDVGFAQQWSLLNTGQSGGTIDADIDATEAWDISTGGVSSLGDSIVVAVVDDGFLLSHPDINFWKNYNEIPLNGLDDDNNGYTDDREGWDAISYSPFIQNSPHGTHIAGIIGAKGNNNSGVTGVNWDVKVLPVSGSTQVESEAIEAYTYVWNARKLYNQSNGQFGAFVVACNTSFGVDQGQSSNFPLWCAILDSLGKEGVLSICATANQNWDVDQVGDIPSTCSSDFLISVTNTDRNDLKSSFGAFGNLSVDLGAPGTSIYSTYSTLSGAPTFNTSSGTSMASPHVAAAIALLYSSACSQWLSQFQYRPDSLALLMKECILSGVDSNSSLNGITVSGGRLNLHKSLLYLANTFCGINFVKELKLLRELKIYPNPLQGTTLNLLLVSETKSIKKICLMNCQGKIVYESEILLLPGKNQFEWDFQNMQSGLYGLFLEGYEIGKLMKHDR